MTIRIKVMEEILTDKSKVYNVIMIDEDAGGIIYLPCVSHKDADQLIETLITAIDQHTVVGIEHSF